MIQTFIEKNRNMLQTYCIAARIIGWVLVILSAMPALLIPFIISGSFEEYPGGIKPMLGALLEVLFVRLPIGLIVLGVAQLIKYLSESEYQPGWLLRHGSVILYFFAVLIFVGSLIRYCFLLPATKAVDSSYIVMHILWDVALMLILIGLGNIFKRVMPMIEESRTLV